MQLGLDRVAAMLEFIDHALLNAFAAKFDGIEGRHEIDKIIGQKITLFNRRFGAFASGQLGLGGLLAPGASIRTIMPGERLNVADKRAKIHLITKSLIHGRLSDWIGNSSYQTHIDCLSILLRLSSTQRHATLVALRAA